MWQTFIFNRTVKRPSLTYVTPFRESRICDKLREGEGRVKNVEKHSDVQLSGSTPISNFIALIKCVIDLKNIKFK